MISKPKSRKYGPGKTITQQNRMWWPEHPLSVEGMVTLAKVKAWQDRGYSEEAFEKLNKRSMGSTNWDMLFGGPGEIYLDKDGYEGFIWPLHPLATNMARRVTIHRLVYWQESGYEERVLELLQSGLGTIHHRNTLKDDNRMENLEMRLTHPAGNNSEDWIHLLEIEGYTVLPPSGRRIE